jgi:hypothetical protein
MESTSSKATEAAVPQIEAATEAQPIAQPILPVCPYCSADPVKLNLMFQKFPGGQIASLVFCGDCRKMLPAQIVGMDQGRIARPKGPEII